MTQKRLQEIGEMFENEEKYGLEGIEANYQQSIDRDQAIDDDGKAIYTAYRFINVETDAEYEVTAEEMEAYAETW